jgi:peptidoglycan/LPS O-acetylase OafA/YrhL
VPDFHLEDRRKVVPRRFATLTGLRGVAAIWVVTFHAYPIVSSLFNWPERALVPVIREGFLAVDLFFILSGFVLSHGYADGFQTSVRNNYAAFLVARVRRIFPLHWVCLGIMVFLVASFPDHWWGPGPFSPHSLISSTLLIQTWIPSTAQAWNHPAWSLSAEWLAYFAFPLIAWTAGFLRHQVLALVMAALALLVLAMLLLGAGSRSLDHVGAGGIARCLCEISAGALIWKAMRDGGGLSTRGSVWMALGGAILGVAVLIPQVQVVAPFGIAALIIGCVLPSRLGQWLFGNRALVGLGEISFSIYLVHAPTLGLLVLIAEHFQVRNAGLIPRIAMLGAIPLFVLGASVLLWRSVETPSRLVLQQSPYLEALPQPSKLGASSAKFSFWLVMIVAMTFSETAADFLSRRLALGYALSFALLLAVAAPVFVARIDVVRFSHLLDWGLILCISMAGTTLSDFLDISVGLGDCGASIALILALLVLRCVWWLIPPGALTRIVGAGIAETMLNWVTVLLAGALLTSLSDLMSQRAGLHEGSISLLILAALSPIAVAAICPQLPRKRLFWVAFVMIRPLGVTFGDALTKSHEDGGLQFGTGRASLILMAAMIVLIPSAGRQLVETIREFQGKRPGQGFL